MAVGIRCADHVTPLYPQKLALTSPTDGGRSVGIVRLRTKATEFFLGLIKKNKYILRKCNGVSGSQLDQMEQSCGKGVEH